MSREASLIDAGIPRRPAVVTLFRILTVFDTVVLLFAAALHVQGTHIPLGFGVFDEPQIVPAAIVEGLAGLLFAVTAYSLFAAKGWAWTMTLIAHVFAILGFLLGIWATQNGTSPFNRVYHLVMLAIFVIGLALLLTSTARAALGRGGSGLAPRRES
jgi:hypothetical protein